MKLAWIDVADAVMAAVHPGVDLERLARDEHAARADDRPPRRVGHLGGDLVLVVRVAVDFLRERGVNLDLHDAVLADGRLDLGDQFRPLRRRKGHQKKTGRGSPSRASPDAPIQKPTTKTVAFERSKSIAITFAPRTTTVIELTLKTKGTPYWSRPDLGIDPEDVKIDGAKMTVTVHSVGSVEAPASKLVLRDKEGKDNRHR